MEPIEFLQRLDAADNEDEVRTRLAAGNYGERHRKLAQKWLDDRKQKRETQQQGLVNEREDEQLKISRRALQNSTNAIRIASAALFLSLVIALGELARWLWYS